MRQKPIRRTCIVIKSLDECFQTVNGQILRFTFERHANKWVGFDRGVLGEFQTQELTVAHLSGEYRSIQQSQPYADKRVVDMEVLHIENAADVRQSFKGFGGGGGGEGPRIESQTRLTSLSRPISLVSSDEPEIDTEDLSLEEPDCSRANQDQCWSYRTLEPITEAGQLSGSVLIEPKEQVTGAG
uniref:Uncharacterized protein n=1 Tax=Tetranychus urticae TaxID=32264 RepID=T1KC09_TETUR